MDNVFAVLHQWPIQSLAAIIAGVVILLVPKILNYAIAAYLLLIGVYGLLGASGLRGVSAEAIIALVAGVLILVRPQILNYVVGIYLLLIGLLGSGILRF